MKADRLRHYAEILLLGGGLITLATACGTTLRPMSPEKTAKLLSPRHALDIREACSTSLKYADQTRRILVYRLYFEHERAVCAASGPYEYELVVVLGPDNHIERYRLLRVR